MAASATARAGSPPALYGAKGPDGRHSVDGADSTPARSPVIMRLLKGATSSPDTTAPWTDRRKLAKRVVHLRKEAKEPEFKPGKHEALIARGAFKLLPRPRAEFGVRYSQQDIRDIKDAREWGAKV